MKFSNSERQVNTHNLLVRKLAILAVAFAMLITSPGMAFMAYATEPAADKQTTAEQSDAPKSEITDETQKSDAAATDAGTKEVQKDDSKSDEAAKTTDEAENGVMEVSSETGSYTVDFYYTPENGKATEYHLKGGSEIMLSELFAKLGIDRDTADIKETVFTDNELVKFVKEGDDYRVISLKPFNTTESLTITFEDGEVIVLDVEDAVVRSGFSGSVIWEIDDAGVLTLKPDTREGISNPGMLGENNNTSTPTWGWYRYNSEIKEIKVEPGVYTQAKAVALFGADNSAGVYPNLKKVDLSGLNISKAQQLQRMFSNVKNLEEIDLSVMTNKEAKNLYNINNLFNGCTNLKKVNLGGLTTRITGVSGATNGCTMSNVFQGCNNLEEVDLSNVKLGGRTNGDDGVQYWFEGKTKLTKVTMTNSQFPGMRRFDSMFEGCTGIETIDMSNVNVSDAQYMRRMFSGCTSLKTLNVSGFGELTKIVNMDGFVSNCTALTTLNMDNLDNSAIGPYNSNHSITENLPSSVGAREYGRELGIETCKALETLSAKNSVIWMTTNNRGLPGSEYYDASKDDKPVYFFTDKAMTFDADAGPTGVVIDSDRDYIDLIIDRDGVDNKHTTSPTKDPLPDSRTNINIKNGDLNTNGPGFLAPGVYTLSGTRSDPDHAPMEDTYYRIAYMGDKPYTVEWPDGGIEGLVKVEDSSHNYVTINTALQTWPPSGNKVIDCGSGIKITYKDVAIDCNGKLHDVIVTVKKITFKDLNKIPTLSTEVGGVAYQDRSHDYNVENNKILADGQAYYRPVLQATQTGITLLNYIRAGGTADPTIPGSGTQMITGGSGTDIDFKIEIDKANDDTSFVFLARDLDVAYSQNWQYNSNGDACYDNLPIGNVTFGEGGEGFVLGEGVDKDTVQFAAETGLYKSGDMVLTTGGDPNTPWSEFTVTGDAKGANFTWTSGVGCQSFILENTKEQDLGEITIQPQVLKTLKNGTLSDGQFEFKLEKVSTDPDGAPEPSGGKSTPTAVPQTKTNDASGNVTFNELVYKTDGKNDKIYGSDSINYFPGTAPGSGETENTHGKGVHNTFTYIYKVTEVQPTNPDPDIVYDTSDHEIKIVISTPENDTEMKQGIKAEVYADNNLAGTYWHSKEYSYYDAAQEKMITLTNKWYNASGAGISDPNAITLNAITFKNKKIKGEIKGDETYGLKNKKQTGEPKYDVVPESPVDVSTLKLVKPEKEGATISDDGKVVTIPGEGKYTLKDNGKIDFEPEKDYLGDPTPITVKGTDTRGNEVTGTYTPHVIDPTDEATATRTVHFKYSNKNGKDVTKAVTQTVTLTRHAAEVDPKTGKVKKWGPWEPATFPAVKNPDAGNGWVTKDVAPELTVTKPGEVKDVYVVYTKVEIPEDEDCPDCNNGDSGSSGSGAKTGDETNIAIWIALIAAAAAVIITVIIRRRRRS